MINFANVITDPFVHFCVFAVLVPPFAPQKKGAPWLNRPTSEILAYYCDPFIIGFCAILGAVYYYVHIHCAKVTRHAVLSDFETWRARWYLLNGVIIHGLLDGCIGAYSVNKILVDSYSMVDKRYGQGHTEYGSAVHVISLLELYWYMPLCIFAYYSFYFKKNYRAVLEAFVSCAQLYGTLVYFLQEYNFNFKSFDVDRNLTFSLHHLLFWWFGVCLGVALWIVVPIWLTIVAMNECRTVRAGVSSSSPSPSQSVSPPPPSTKKVKDNKSSKKN